MTYTRDWVEANPIDHTKFSAQPGAVRLHKVDISDRLKAILYGFVSGETVTTEGVKNLPLYVQAADPGATTNKIKIYGKDVSAKVEAHLQDEDGDVIQLTKGGELNVDVIQDGALMVTSAAPTVDAGVSNKKYVDDQLAAIKIAIQQTTKTDTFSFNTATTWSDITGLSVNITPKSVSSKILVSYNLNCASSTDGAFMAFRILRDSTEIGSGASGGNRIQCHNSMRGRANNANSSGSESGSHLDSPASAVQITYKVQVYIENQTFYLNRSAADTDSVVHQRAESTITVIEIP